MSSYATKTNRRRLVGAYSEKIPLGAMLYRKEEGEFLLQSTDGRLLLLSTQDIPEKTTRSTQGGSGHGAEEKPDGKSGAALPGRDAEKPGPVPQRDGFRGMLPAADDPPLS